MGDGLTVLRERYARYAIAAADRWPDLPPHEQMRQMFQFIATPRPVEWMVEEWALRKRRRAIRAIEEARNIPLWLRDEVLASGPCAYCGDPFPTCVDHIWPVSLGGSRRRRNLAPACRSCNSEKLNATPGEWRAWRAREGTAVASDRHGGVRSASDALRCPAGAVRAVDARKRPADPRGGAGGALMAKRTTAVSFSAGGAPWQHGLVMTFSGARTFWRPSYLRRAPRWHDGAGRLLDLGGTFDLRLGPESNDVALLEDWVMVRDDLRRALDVMTTDDRTLQS